MQFSCQSSFIPSCSHTASLQSRGGRNEGRAPYGIQLRNNHTTFPKLSEAIVVVLKEVEKKQTEMLTWPLTDLKNADRCRTVLTQIQSVLIEVLARQHLEKNNLKYWSMPYSLQQRLLRSQLICLASYQRKLMEILNKQFHLVMEYVSIKGKLPTESSIYQQGSMKESQQPELLSPLASIPESSKHQEAFSCYQDSQQREISGTQVIFRDKSLSYYSLNSEAKGYTCKTHFKDNVQHNRTVSAQEMLTETTSSNHQMKFKMIHFVDDAELLPNAIMDYYWDMILSKSYLLSADWADYTD